MTDADTLDDLLGLHRPPSAREPWRDTADAVARAAAHDDDDDDEDSDEDTAPAAVPAPAVLDTVRNPWATHGRALRDRGWCAFPVSFPGATVVPGVEKTFVASLGKSPGKWTPEGWRPMARWNAAGVPTETALRAYAAWPESNIGLRLGRQGDGTVAAAVDSDVAHPAAADEIEALARRMLGAAPRRIGRAPRVALLYRVHEPMEKRTTRGFRLPGDPDGAKEHRVELMCEGQQVVIFGQHPSGSTYTWPGGVSPATMSPADLPLVTPEQLQAFLDAADALLAREGTPVSRVTHSRGAAVPDQGEKPRERRAKNPAECMEAARTLDLSGLSYDDWVAVAHAIKGAFGDTDEARELWMDLTRASARHSGDDADPVRVWDSIKDSDIRSGAGSIYLWAEERHGWVPRSQRVGAPEEDFDAVDDTPEAVRAITSEGWFVAEAGSGVAVGRLDPRRGLVLMKPSDFELLKRNIRVPTKRGTRPAGGMWLDHPSRPTHAGVGLYPPWTSAPSRFLNLWTGWGVEPKGGRAACRCILRHMLDLVCQGDKPAWKWLLRWFAAGVQGADRGRAAAVMIQGGQGTGKTALSDLAARIYGRAYLRVANGDHLTGRFNVHLADKMFIGSEEAIFVGDRKAQDALKNLITGTILTAEAKFGAVIQAPNHIRLLMTTNASHAVHLEGDNRRIAVFQTGPKKPAAHYAALFSEIKGHGAGAFLNMLLRMDLSGFREQEDIPHTRARAEQKLASLSGVERWWEAVLRGAGAGARGLGGPSDWFAGNPVASATVAADYEDAARRGGERIVPPVLFWKALRKVTEFTKSRPRVNSGAQVPSVTFQSLTDARAAFEAALGITGSMEWDE